MVTAGINSFLIPLGCPHQGLTEGGQKIINIKGNMQIDNYPQSMTTKEVASYLRVSISTILRMIKRGDLDPAYKNRSYYFSKQDLMEFINQGGVQ